MDDKTAPTPPELYEGGYTNENIDYKQQEAIN